MDRILIGVGVQIHAQALAIIQPAMGNKRYLYNVREKDIVNERTVELEESGDLAVEGWDLDRDLEKFVGSREWEGGSRVKKSDVPRVHELLKKELGEGELLDLIEKKFGGTISALTNFDAWLEEHKIHSTSTRWE
jgi:hypothetical protein